MLPRSSGPAAVRPRPGSPECCWGCAVRRPALADSGAAGRAKRNARRLHVIDLCFFFRLVCFSSRLPRRNRYNIHKRIKALPAARGNERCGCVAVAVTAWLVTQQGMAVGSAAPLQLRSHGERLGPAQLRESFSHLPECAAFVTGFGIGPWCEAERGRTSWADWWSGCSLFCARFWFSHPLKHHSGGNKREQIWGTLR